LGNGQLVGGMGEVWHLHAPSFQLLAAVRLMEFTRDRSFSKEELEFYKLGLAEIPTFLEMCQKEALEEIKKASKKD